MRKRTFSKYDLIAKGILARMLGDHRRLSKVCTALRNLSERKNLTAWQEAHRLMLEVFATPFEQDLEGRFQQLQVASSLLNPNDRSNCFLYLYEYSGFLPHQRKYIAALEYSAQAESKSYDLNSRLAAGLNTLIAKEALGSDDIDKINEFEKQINCLPKNLRNPKIVSEFFSLKLRYWFRRGQIDQISKYNGPRIFYYVWLCHLPQLNLSANHKPLEFDLDRKKQSYLEFNISTLSFRNENPRIKNPPLPKWCDRLYLWTWTAFKNPEKLPFSLILDLLEEFEFEKEIHRMTIEDRIMVYHCLSLLSFFDPKTKASLNPLFEKLGPIVYDNYPLLAYERAFIGALKICIEGDPFTQIKHKNGRDKKLNPLVLYFPKKAFTREFVCEVWPGFSQIAWRLPKRFENGVQILVDTLLGRVADIHEKWVIESFDMAKAFRLFLTENNHSAIPMGDFVRIAFGQLFFDSFLHYRKIYNLLSRMKKISLGAFDYRIRNEVIYFKISSGYFALERSEENVVFEKNRWRRIVFRIRQNIEASTTQRRVHNIEVNLTPLLMLNSQCTRAQIQKSCGWSKPMAVRNINKLLRDGIIKKHGHGRSTKYSISVEAPAKNNPSA